MRDPFRRDHAPRIGMPEELEPGLRVVTAPNASPMTHTGTRTYLLGDGPLAVIDPGPEDAAHLAALLAALGGAEVSHILVTHAHLDHSPLARRLSRDTGAPVLAFGDALSGRSAAMEALGPGLGGGEGVDRAFAPDITLADGARVEGAGWTLEVVHTPGHMGGHLAFGWGDRLFSGDHVMGWATTLVSPPDGDLTDFMASLDKVAARRDRILYPGHGAPVAEPAPLIAHIRDHRLMREAQVLEELARGPADTASLVAAIYRDVDPRMWPMARRNVLAHLVDLTRRGIVAPEGALTAQARFALV